MHQKIKILSIVLLVCLLFAQCKSGSRQDIEFIPIGEFDYTPATVKAGTPIDLIAFSGGKANKEGEVYYYQFIGIDAKNGDTLRILSTFISVADDEDNANKIYIATSEYDAEKRITSAIFYPQDSTHELPIDFSAAGLAGDTSDLDKMKSVVQHGIKKREYVIINKSIDIFENNYKTVFGILHFTERPY
jgi:hypothetical protein